MSFETASNSAGTEGKHSSNPFTDFVSGAGDAVFQPIKGAEQLLGQNVDAQSSANKSNDLAYEAGAFVTNAAIYMGSAALLSRVPKVGAFAPAVAGGALGFLQPIDPSKGMATRLENGALGAGTMLALQHDPQLLGKGLPNALAFNGVVGAANTQLESVINKGHAAGIGDTVAGATTWAAMGGLFHAIGLSRDGATTAEEVKPPLYPTVPAPEGALGSGDFAVGLQSEGRARAYDIHVPADYDGKSPLPVMVVLDGVNGQTQGVRAAESQMNNIADANKFAVVYPYAEPGHSIPLVSNVHSWNAEGTGLTNTFSEYDDRNFIDDVLKDVRGRIAVDNNRLYGVGFSEGGLFMNYYQATRPGTFAGIGSVHGTIMGSEPNPGSPVDAVIIHGTNDKMLPYGGGRGLMTALMPKASDSKPFQQARFWAGVNQSLPPDAVDTTHFTQTDYVSQSGENRVREYVVKGGQHAWDGSPMPGWPIVGRPAKPEVFHTSERLWDFLRNSRLSRTLESNTTVPFPAAAKPLAPTA